MVLADTHWCCKALLYHNFFCVYGQRFSLVIRTTIKCYRRWEILGLLMGTLLVFQEENLSAMNTDPWYSAYHYSHPPLVERLVAIDEPDKKEK